MRGRRAKKGQERNACLAAAVASETAAVKLAKQQEVAMEMKLGEDAAWDCDLYESEYLWWWEKWNYEERGDDFYPDDDSEEFDANDDFYPDEGLEEQYEDRHGPFPPF